MPDYQDAAAVAGRGLAVFLLPAGSKAAGPGWQRRCTADLEVLARTWPDGANIGVGCRASGIVGLDLDRTFAAPSLTHADASTHENKTLCSSPGRHLTAALLCGFDIFAQALCSCRPLLLNIERPVPSE